MRGNRLSAMAMAALLALAGCSAGLPQLPPRARPDSRSDEAGLWLVAAKSETALQQAPTAIGDPALNRYVRGVACKVAGPYCPDIRVYLVREPGLDARMLPNGALQIGSGLLLRLRDEAQLAAVIGHELGHYVERHTFDKAWRQRVGSDIRAWLGILAQGLVGSGAGDAADAVSPARDSAFSRSQEDAADAFGLRQMVVAGYAPAAAADFWRATVTELGERRSSIALRLLARHPMPEARRDRLNAAVAAIAAQPSMRGYVRYQAALAPFRSAFLADEVRLRLPTETLGLFERLRRQQGLDATLAFYWGEVYRLRGWKDDRPQALRFYAEASRLPGAPAALDRSIGLVRRGESDWPAARAAFRRYLAAAPDAADAAMIRAYLAEMPEA